MSDGEKRILDYLIPLGLELLGYEWKKNFGLGKITFLVSELFKFFFILVSNLFFCNQMYKQ